MESDISAYCETPYSQANGNTVSEIDISDVISGLDEADRQWQNGTALEYMLESCAKVHKGDVTAITFMFLSYASTRVINGDGIHICLSGSAGTGKSHTAETVAEHLPTGAVMSAGVSDKALYYHESYKPGTVFIIDDQELSESFQEAIKKATTSWDKPTTYLTVANQKEKTLTIKERCPFWLVKANLTGDEQIHDRMLMLWTDETSEQRITIQQQVFLSALKPDIKMDDTSQKICRAIWSHIESAIVIIPYALYIVCDEWMDPRNSKMFVALIQAYALMRAPKRSKRVENGVLYIDAAIKDFIDASFLFNPLLNNRGGSQKLKLSSSSAMVLDFLAKQPSGLIPLREICNALGISGSVLSHALHGRNDQSSDGLAKLCPAIEIVSETVPRLKNPGTFQQKSIMWNLTTYNSWASSAGMFALDTQRMREDGVFLDELAELDKKKQEAMGHDAAK